MAPKRGVQKFLFLFSSLKSWLHRTLRDCKPEEHSSAAWLEQMKSRFRQRLNCHRKLANALIKLREAASPGRPSARLDGAHDGRCQTRTDAISPPCLKTIEVELRQSGGNANWGHYAQTDASRPPRVFSIVIRFLPLFFFLPPPPVFPHHFS